MAKAAPHPALDPKARRARVVGDLDAYPGLRDVLVDLELFDGLEGEIDRCVPPLLASPAPSRKVRRRYGAKFDVDEVRWFLEFCLLARHFVGEWEGYRFVPDLWQILYVIAPVFGWRKKNGARLYRTLYLEVPRKNGKSTLSAVIALFLLLADRNRKAGTKYEAGAQVYSAASTKDQARAVFGPAENMVRQSERFSKAVGIKTGERLVFERALSFYQVLSGVPEKAEEKMGLNPSGIVIDELHTHRDRRLVDTLESATGARSQPLEVIITTADLDEEGTIYDEKRVYAEAIAEGELEDPTFFGVIYTIPEELVSRWDDLEVIRCANPALGVGLSEDYFDDVLPKARVSDERKGSFCRLHLNLRTGATTTWVPLEKVRASGAFVAPTWDELYGLDAYGGLDLASSTDLAAASFVVPRWVDDPTDSRYEIEALEVVIRAWTPEAKLKDRAPRERALFAHWIEEGILTAHEGETIDYDLLEEDLFEIADHLTLKRLHFDRWGSKQIVGHLRTGGIEVVEMGQGFASMSPAMKLTEALLLERRLRFGGNPLFLYAMKGLRVTHDKQENVKPDRDKSRNRIDPFVSTVMAVDGYARGQDDRSESVYESRGLVTA